MPLFSHTPPPLRWISFASLLILGCANTARAPLPAPTPPASAAVLGGQLGKDAAIWKEVDKIDVVVCLDEHIFRQNQKLTITATEVVESLSQSK